MSELWYFAYGSNLSVEQMKNRTKELGVYSRVKLYGYRLAFNKRGKDGTSKANLVAHPGGVVWGVAYRLSTEALKLMDRHEGVASGHYQRLIVEVHTDLGHTLEAVAYIAQTAYLDHALAPSSQYLQTILQGARHHGLPEAYIAEIQKAAQALSHP